MRLHCARVCGVQAGHCARRLAAVPHANPTASPLRARAPAAPRRCHLHYCEPATAARHLDAYAAKGKAQHLIQA